MISQSDIIDEYSFDQIGWARFDKTGRFRFRLGRKLTPKLLDKTWDEIIAFSALYQRVVFVMLNPSKATADQPDNTVTRCCEFARRWGADLVEVVNLFAFRATDPRELRTARPRDGESPIAAIGGDVSNTMEILSACTGASRVIAAWGNGGTLYDQDKRVRDLLDRHDIRLEALRFSKDGYPNHPLARGKNFIPYDVQPQVWAP